VFVFSLKLRAKSWMQQRSVLCHKAFARYAICVIPDVYYKFEVIKYEKGKTRQLEFPRRHCVTAFYHAETVTTEHFTNLV